MVEYTGRRWPRPPRTSTRSAAAEDLPAHVEAVGHAREQAVTGFRRAAGPRRPGGQTAYGAPQLDVPVQLNTNENPYPPSAALVARSRGRRRGGRALNRYPDRDAVALRADLAGYLGHGLTRGAVWAANGSNEIMQQLLQAFGGPGRTALGFEPSYSMHPLIAAAPHRLDRVARDEDFSIEPEPAVAAIGEHRPDLVFLTSPNNPTGTALARRGARGCLRGGPGHGGGGRGVRRVRPAPGHRADLLPRYPRLVVSRTMSKAFAPPGPARLSGRGPGRGRRRCSWSGCRTTCPP